MDSNATLCPDWVFLNNSNVHVAKDRGCFKSYTPFPSKVDASPFASTSSHHIPVLGIGTVEIPTKRSPNMHGAYAHGTLILHEVLHVPDALCNFIGQPLMLKNGCSVTMGGGPKSKGVIRDDQGKNIAYFDPKISLFAIKMRHSPDGPKLGETVFRKGMMYMLSCRWDASEERKWEDFKAKNEAPGVAEGSDDHEDGDDETDLEGHQADFNFTAPQLEWIKKHCGNSDHFMKCLGLEFFKEEDLEEAKMTVGIMMSDDD